MHYVLEPFGCLQEKMGLDMGFGRPNPQLQVTPIPIDHQGMVLGFASVDVTIVIVVVQEIKSQLMEKTITRR